MGNNDALWAGGFGDDYTARNRVDWSARVPFWNRLLQHTQPRSVLEAGCNAGWNMRAIRGLDHRIELRGVDVNFGAVGEARRAGLDVYQLPAHVVGTNWPASFDLVFTAGVLIHVDHERLPDTMAAIALASRRWVLAIEYGAEQDEPIEYRGHSGALWRRPFGKLYEDMGLRIVEQGVLLKPTGFDNCHYWLCEK